MKRIAKYITLLLSVVIAAIGYANGADSSVAETLPREVTTEFSTTYIDSTTHSCDITLSRQVSSPSTVQLHGTTKRTNNAHKNNFEFTKAGKHLNSCIGGFIHQHNLTLCESSAGSILRLIRLGRLII